MRGDERQESPFCGAGGRAGCLEGDPLQGLCRGPNAINTRERGVKARLLLVWARSSSSGGGLGGYEITPELNQGSVCVGGRAGVCVEGVGEVMGPGRWGLVLACSDGMETPPPPVCNMRGQART